MEGVQAGVGTKRGGRAHKLRGQIEPGIAKVEALAKGGHGILVGGHVLKEGAEKLAIRLGEEGRARGIRRFEKAILYAIDGIWRGKRSLQVSGLLEFCIQDVACVCVCVCAYCAGALRMSWAFLRFGEQAERGGSVNERASAQLRADEQRRSRREYNHRHLEKKNKKKIYLQPNGKKGSPSGCDEPILGGC